MARTQDSRARPFTEKNFYLGEFRDRTLAFGLPALLPHEAAAIESVLKELEANPTPSVLLSSDREGLAALAPLLDQRPDAPGLLGAVWRGLREHRRVGLLVDVKDASSTITDVALRLGLAKLVWIDPAGGLTRESERVSFLDLEELSGLLRAGPLAGSRVRGGLLGEIQRGLREGLPAVNLCTAEGLADELFTYAGSGTLFTSERYVDVRPLALDDFDAAADLVARGESEGYLAQRTPEQLDRIFAHGYGAFVEGRHLAGIGALLPYDAANAGEIASLYALTRFLGEGIGGHITRALARAARQQGREFVFACTTTERVAGFFERQGFTRVDGDQIPDEKWASYDPRRRPRVRSLRLDL
jgi:N-acetylglutamate synthase-like GNAT family acetyltransferase